MISSRGKPSTKAALNPAKDATPRTAGRTAASTRLASGRPIVTTRNSFSRRRNACSWGLLSTTTIVGRAADADVMADPFDFLWI
jgi:hypothetical protein